MSDDMMDDKRKPVIGTVTIGQSPRSDLIPEIKAVLGDGVDILEAGALDGMTLEQVRAISPEPGDYALVTRMADGTSVRVAERHILARMQRQIASLNKQGVDIVALVCTGDFPPFESERLVVRPQRILFSVVKALGEGLRLGVLMPDADQIPKAEAVWSNASLKCLVRAASPYEDSARIASAAADFKRWGAELVVLDCIGFTLSMKQMVTEMVGCPVILARSIVSRVLAELVGGDPRCRWRACEGRSKTPPST